MSGEEMFDSAPVMIWHLTTDGRVVRANKAACEDLGLDREEIEGKSIHNLFPLNGYKFCRDYETIAQTGKPVLGSVERYYTKGGSERWSVCNKIPVMDPDGKVTGIAVFATDITGHKETEEELKKSRRSLEKANEILALHAELVDKILDSTGDIDVDALLADICQRLSLNSMFLYRCSDDIELVGAWTQDGWEFREQVSPDSTDFGILHAWMSQNEFAWGHVSRMPKGLLFGFDDTTIKRIGTLVMTPILMAGQPWGIAGFGTVNGRYWTQKELEALQNLGKLVAILAKNQKMKSAFEEHIELKISEIKQISNAMVAYAG